MHKAKVAHRIQMNFRVSKSLSDAVRAFADRLGMSANEVGIAALAHYVGSR